METNRIIEELRAVAALDWGQEQKAFYEQRAADAKPVECVPLRDVFDESQMLFLRVNYRAQQKMCYKNAAELVTLMERHAWMFPEPGIYIEGFAYELWPIEHAFVKVGDKYIDPTFERTLHLDVRKEMYASCIELPQLLMSKYQDETGYYGELYKYDYLCKHRPELAERERALNPQNRKKKQKTAPSGDTPKHGAAVKIPLSAIRWKKDTTKIGKNRHFR